MIRKDGTWRESQGSPIFPEEQPLSARETDVALARYFDKPRPANDNHKVYRTVQSGARYTGYCSSSVRYVDVALPRVSLIDGAYAGEQEAA